MNMPPYRDGTSQSQTVMAHDNQRQHQSAVTFETKYFSQFKSF